MSCADLFQPAISRTLMMMLLLRPFLAIVILLTFNGFIVSTQTLPEDRISLCSNNETVKTIDIYSTSQNVIITSPNFGGDINSPNQNCSLVLRTGANPLILSFQINSLEVENETSCNHDYLCLHGMRLCGSWPTNTTLQYILPEFSYFTVFFKTDDSFQTSGFKILLTNEVAVSQLIYEATGEVGNSGQDLVFTPATYHPGYQYTDRCSNHPQEDRQENNSTTEAQVTTQPRSDLYTLCDINWSGVVELNAFSPAVLIQSPNFGIIFYDNNLQCTAVIRSGAEPLILSFSYSSFSLESGQCVFDSLCVNGIRYCGDWLSRRTFHNVLPPYSNFTIRFSTDVSVRGLGFQFHVTPEYARNQNIQEARGSFGGQESDISYSSVIYYDGYPYYDRCAVLPSTYPPYSAETTPSTTYPPHSDERSSTITPTPEHSTAPGDVYQFCDPNRSSYVYIYEASTTFRIRSPNYGGLYENNQNCSIFISTRWQPVVLYFNYRSFALETHQTCSYDSLCVYGVKYCDFWLNGHTFAYIIQPYSTFTLLFKSDNSNVQTGFEIYATTELAINQTIDIATEGYGYSPSTINYTTVTYSRDYFYTDRCVNAPTTTRDYPSETTRTYQTETTSQSQENSTNPGTVYQFCDSNRSSYVYIYEASTTFRIRSPNYGGLYENNQNCSIFISTYWQPMVLYFNYRSFALEPHQTCSYDSLCVYGVKYCDFWLNGHTFAYIIQPYSTFTLLFKSDYSNVQTGFEIYATTELATNQTIDIATEGYGYSPNTINYTTVTYSRDYFYTDRCVDAPTTTRDYPSETTRTYQTETTSQSQDNSTNPQGNNVHYFCDYYTPWNVVNINAASSPVIIRSPNYSRGTYYNNQACNLVLRSGQDPLILSLNYKDFQLELCNCNCDYLCVYGVNLCGSAFRGSILQYILPEYSEFTFKFRTDGSVLLYGFEMYVTAELATNQTIDIATDGYGASPSTLNYTTVTYSREYFYTDRCMNASTTTRDYPSETTRTYQTETTSQSQENSTNRQDVHYFCDYTRPNVVHINATSAPVFIRSPNYPVYSYTNYHDCTVVLRSGPEPLILSLNYKNFQLEWCSGCGCDYLCVHGVKLCGTQIGSIFQYILPEYSELTLRFSTDGSVVETGFEIEVSQVQAVNQSIIEATNGNAYNGISYTWVNFPLESPYIDKCAISYSTNYTTPTFNNVNTTQTPSCPTTVDEVDTAITEAINSLYRAQALLRQRNLCSC